jgi:23S rRNA (uracil1939-C5)-methyltransferase
LADPAVEDPLASPQEWEYRDRLELHLVTREGRWEMGYRTPDGSLLAVPDCLLGSPPVREALRSLYPAFHPPLSETIPLPKSQTRRAAGEEIRLLVRDNGRGGAVAAAFVPELSDADLASLRQALEGAGLFGWQIRYSPSPKARLFRSRLMDQGGDPAIFIPMGDGGMMADPIVFTQANRSAAPLLTAKVLESLPDGVNLLDLYGGYGPFALEYLFHQGGRATVVESSPAAVRAGRDFARAQGLPAVYIQADLAQPGENLPRILGRFGAAVVDPPRGGMDREVIRGLNEAGPSRLVYVSCHAAMLARDVKMLGRYRPLTFTPVDLFPQTPDVEIVAVMDRV